jgi:hypothetical protein
MMRRKFGILLLIGITVLAGTQEAARQFDGLKSSLNNFTRASLWSGLIVYAQPVSDGNLPTPQIYYLMPTPQRPAVPAAQQPLLADNSNGNVAPAAKPEIKNNHGEEAEASNPEETTLVATREVEDAAKSELALNKLPLNLIASHFVAPNPAPKLDRARVYEEVARNEPPKLRRFKFKHDAADLIARASVKEFEDAKLVAEMERLVAEQGELERLKLQTRVETENLHRRMELRVVRRPARPEHLDRIKVINHLAEKRGVALPDMSSIGCEKTRTKPEVAPAPAPVAKTVVQVMDEPAVEWGLPAVSNTTGTSWTLNCDTEPEQK